MLVYHLFSLYLRFTIFVFICGVFVCVFIFSTAGRVLGNIGNEQNNDLKFNDKSCESRKQAFCRIDYVSLDGLDHEVNFLTRKPYR